MMKDDAIDQINKVRHVISEENGHDPQKLVNYYIKLQRQYPHLAQFEKKQTEIVQAS